MLILFHPVASSGASRTEVET